MIYLNKFGKFFPCLSLIYLLAFSFCFLPEPSLAAKKNAATTEPAEVHMRTGLKRMRAKDYEGAADDFLQACYFSRNQYNPEGWLYLGLCRKACRNYPKAIEALQNHLKQTTDKSPDAHIDLAECYLNIGQFDRARDEIDRGRQDADWQNTRPYFAMGELLERMDRPGEALESYCQALGDHPEKSTDAWMGKARCEMKMGDYNLAIKDYKAIIDSSAKTVPWTELYYNLGQCYYQRGDHQGAIDRWHYVLKDDPNHFDSHLALARIFDEEKHTSSALTEYENALRCAPKGINTESINRRIVFLQGKLNPVEQSKEIKPTPMMRQQDEKTKELPKEDSGF